MARCLIILITLLGLCSHCLADGVMMVRHEVGQSQAMIHSPRQEALLVTDGQHIRVVLRTYFRSDAKDVAWVVPVPASPQNIEPADEALFAQLDQRTAPRFYHYEHGSGGLSCGCAATAGRAPLVQPAVRVERTGSAGVYDYAVLFAKDAEPLVQWLNEHGYAMPSGAAGTFAQYAAAGWHFLAMRLRPQEASGGTRAPHPISYQYEATTLTFPLVVSRASADDENEVLLYILGQSRYAPSNWDGQQSIAQSEIHASPSSSSGTNYEQILRNKTLGTHTFVTEFAARIDGRKDHALRAALRGEGGLELDPAPAYLTRLRTIIRPEQMDRDVNLSPRADLPDVLNDFALSDAAERAEVRLSVLLIGTLLLVPLIRRWRRASMASILLALLAAVVMVV